MTTSELQAERFCKNCGCFEPFPDYLRGRCKAHAPVFLYTDDTARWPIVSGDDWCCEYWPANIGEEEEESCANTSDITPAEV